ncbi:MAG: hypothetical protein INR65_01960 [Gluconacetobacter diazotrophicus]|nr:hypothetical protein [Gluconacetobacter diazotrophicus]
MREDAAVAAYLATLERTGSPGVASQESGMSRSAITTLRESDTAFARAYDDAIAQAADLLEAEAWRRAVHGVSVPLMHNGRPVLDEVTGEPIMVRRYSDMLMAMLLRGCKPEKFSLRGRSPVPADPMDGLKDIAFDNDPPQQQTGRC